jgi:hypothetical protein
MQLHDMKFSKDGKEESVVIAMSEIAEADFDRERYPWGLRLTLCKDSLKKMGLDAKGMEPGKNYKLVAKAEVESVSINKRKDDEMRGLGGTSVEMQITELGLEPLDDFGSAFAEAVEN